MNHWIWTLIAIIPCWLYCYFRKKLNYFKDRNVPYVPGWPLIGNMLDIVLGRKNLFDVTRDLYFYNKEAKYVGIFDFDRPVIMLRDLDVIKSVLVKNFDHFIDRIPFIDRSVDPDFGNTLFNLRGNEWREARSLVTSLYTSSKLRNTYLIIVDQVGRLSHHVEQIIAKDPNNIVDMKNLFSRHEIDVMGKYAFGVEFNALADQNNGMHQFGKDLFSNGGMLSFKLLMARGLPHFMRLFRIRLVDVHFAEVLKNVIISQVRIRDKENIRKPDLIQSMIDLRDKSGREMDVTKMAAISANVFFGSYETVATFMCLMLHELACSPDMQLKLQNEIDELSGRMDKDEITYEMINGLPYLEAVYLETQRRHSQAAAVDRSCNKRFELPAALPGGEPLVLEPGDAVTIPVSAIHVDPQIYEEPQRFWPERFLHCSLKGDMSLLSFGAGPRNCVAMRTSHIEIKTMTFFLLRKFNVRPCEKTAIPLKYSKRNFFLSAENGFYLRFQLRNQD